MEIKEQERIRQAVRARYGQVAASDGSVLEKKKSASGCCGGPSPSKSETGKGCGCGSAGSADLTLDQWQLMLGYSNQDLESTPKGANMGLGCGNPVALASLVPGETVLDLGSGGGFDCFLAAARVGAHGRVIGVDMTAEMVAKARLNAQQLKVSNVEFRLGEIEHLPAADSSADIIISNCVVNLSTDKSQVFREAMRVLKPGGRLAVSDILAIRPLPPEIRKDLALVSACVGGAATIEDTRSMLESAGFTDIRIETHTGGTAAMSAAMPGRPVGDYVVSADIKATKPGLRSPKPIEG